MILITGAAGQVGAALAARLGEADTPGRETLDLADPTGITRHLESTRPAMIVNCAAFNAVDGAEEDEAMAHRINATAVEVLARYAAGAAIPFVTFSSDYVFDGTASQPYVESSPTNPINAYGRSKLAGERAALAAHPGALVIRTSWVMSATRRNFATIVLERTAAGTMDVVTDQRGCPTLADDLADATVRALRAGISGILHLTNTGEATWYEVAREVCAITGVDPARVRPTTTAEFGSRAPRPRYSVLGSERDSGIVLRPWREALRSALTPR